MRTSLFSRMPRLMRLAAALLVAAVLVGTGWAAERIYRMFTEIEVTLDTYPEQSFTLPSGRTIHWGGGSCISDVSSKDPKAMETARRHHEEMKKLIAERRYKPIGSYESFGERKYCYEFTFSDGTLMNTGFEFPLESMASWDDYWRKLDKKFEGIKKALVAGRYRLIDVDVIRRQICRDVASNEKLDVEHVRLPSGEEVRHATAQNPKGPTCVQEMSWQDHLKAIREGKRELLGLKTVQQCTYEVVLEDGSKTTYNYDGELLEKPQKEVR